MDTSKDYILQSLNTICNDVINKLDELHEKGLISDEEYMKHTSLKRQFLKNTANIIDLEKVI